MSKSDSVFVLGDSHVRSFAYSKNVVPCFIGPGKTLLLSNSELREKTSIKIKRVLQYLPKSALAVVLVGEPTLRFFLDGGHNDSDYSSTFVKAFCYQFNKLHQDIKKIHPNLVMLPPVPRRDSRYAKIWEKVVSILRAEGFLWAGAFDTSVVDGYLKAEMIGDYIHANEQLADEAMRFIGYENHYSSDLYAWQYQYEIADGAKIWGGVSKELLKYTGTNKRDWSSILVKTTCAKEFISILNNYLRLFFSYKTKVGVTETGEGFFTLGLRNAVRVGRISSLETKRSTVLQSLLRSSVPSDSECASIYKISICVVTELDALERIHLDFSDATLALKKSYIYKERSFRKDNFVVVVRSSFIRYLSIRSFMLLYKLISRCK
jgi:hypothetical protein